MAKKSVREKPKLVVEKRKITGRKVKKLRQQGILPANIYGKKVKSLAVQVELKSFLPVFKKTGETGLVELQVKGEKKIRPVLIHNLQLNPVTDQPLHADFYQVDLKEKVTTEVPVELVGESLAVKEKEGVLIQPLSEVEVEALPTELPDKLEVDLSGLKEIGDMVTVGEIKPPAGVKILTPSGEVLVKIEPPTKEEAPPSEEEAPAEEAEGKKEKEEKEEAKKPEEKAKAPAKEEEPTKKPAEEHKQKEQKKE